MKYLFLHAKAKQSISIPLSLTSKLPKKIVIATTAQFAHQLKNWKKQLSLRGITVFSGKGKHARLESQILGCDVLAVTSKIDKADAVLYIGDGFFHPKGILLQTEKPVYCYNPLTKEHKIMTRKDIEKELKKRKAAISKFYMAKNIGILVSTKFGQQHLSEAVKFRKKIEKENKKGFVFISDTLDFSELENFNFIDVWVNTMCPRIALDDFGKARKPIINISDIHDFKY